MRGAVRMNGLRRSATTSALWAGVEASSVSLFSFVVLLVMARVLTPADFGTAAIALSLVQIVSVIGEFLFHDAIVHRAGLTREQSDSAHTVTVLLGMTLSALVMGCAPVIEILFAIKDVASVLFWMAPSIFFSSLSAVPVAMLRRNLEFRTVALRMIFGRLMGGVIAIAAAFAGMGLWSIVLQQVATAAFASLVLLLLGSTYATMLPRFGSPTASSVLLRFGTSALAVNLLWGNVGKIFLVGCSLVLTQSGIGIVAMAMRLVDTLASIILGAQSKVALPLFSRVHHETGAVRNAYVAGLRLSSYMVVPLFVGLGAAAHDIVLAFAGERWIEAVPLVQIFAAGQVVRSLTLGGAVLTAIGRPSANLLLSAVDLLAALGLLMVLGPIGMVWVAAAWVLRLAVSMPVTVYLLRCYAGVELGDLFVGTYRAVFASAVVAAAVIAGAHALAVVDLWLRLSLSLFLGVVVYAGAIWCIDRKLLSVPRELLVGKA
jgi:O-antigen/teichoic acid export membrane protein